MKHNLREIKIKSKIMNAKQFIIDRHGEPKTEAHQQEVEAYAELMEEYVEELAKAGQVDALVNRQNRFVIEPTQQDNGWTYWVWEGDPFDRELVCRFSSLEEAKEWITYKVGG